MARRFASGDSLLLIDAAFNFNPRTQLTFACWVRPDAVVGVQILCDGENGATTGQDMPSPYLNGAQFGYFNGSADQIGGTIVAKVWHHVALVFWATDDATAAGNSSAVYVNGVQVTTGNNVGAKTSDRMRLGTDTTNHFVGVLDDVGFWNTRLQAGEIARLAAGDPPESIRPSRLISVPDLSGPVVWDKVRKRVWTASGTKLTAGYRLSAGSTSFRRRVRTIWGAVLAGGGTTFTQSLTATKTRTAALATVATYKRTLTGTRTRTASIVKLVSKSLGAVTLTRTATLKKTVPKALSASLSRSAALSRAITWKTTLTAARTRTAALAAGLVTKKTLTATLTRTAALATSTVVGGGARLWRTIAIALGLRQ